MNELEIKDYASRQWSRISAHDRSYWVAEYRRHGYSATQKASLSLWQHMKSIRQEWPDEAERQQDLAHHIAFKKLLERTADALATGHTVRRP